METNQNKLKINQSKNKNQKHDSLTIHKHPIAPTGHFPAKQGSIRE